MEGVSFKFLAIGLVMIGGTFGASYGLGTIFSTWIKSIARNPATDGKLRQVGLIGFASAELILLMSFAIAVLLIFVA
jgi:F0F1-type ATP synthase membrane subunit c/vacuolar-type H+-ATPase subunit K